MGVQGGVAVAVADFNHIAITTLTTCKSDHAVTHRHGGSPCWGGIVHTTVCLQCVENGVQTHGKTTGLTRKSQRRGQVRAAQAFAIHVVVVALLSWLLEPDRVVLLVVIVEFGAEHAARTQGLTIGLKHFVNHRKTSTFAECAVEVDLV